MKHVSLRSKALTKSQPIVNKRDLMYIYDIKEFSDLNLYLDELEEVRGIDAYRYLPERLVQIQGREKDDMASLQDSPRKPICSD